MGLLFFVKKPDIFLKSIKGVIHVGANSGQEANIYGQRDLNVFWIEPNPAAFQRLKINSGRYPKQRICCQLITDKDDKEYDFHISNFWGCSSSIYEMQAHRKLWPHIFYKSKLKLKSATLLSVITNNQVDLALYDALVLDTQGSELLILKGAGEILSNFRYVKIEAADFQVYKNGCQLKDIELLMRENGFKIISQKAFAGNDRLGHCYDLIYKRG